MKRNSPSENQLKRYLLLQAKHSYNVMALEGLIGFQRMFKDAKPCDKWREQEPHDLAGRANKFASGMLEPLAAGIGARKGSMIYESCVAPAIEEHDQHQLHHIIWNKVCSVREYEQFDYSDTSKENRRGIIWPLQWDVGRRIGCEVDVPTLDFYIAECALDAVCSNMENRRYNGGPHPIKEIMADTIPKDNHGIASMYMRLIAGRLSENDAERLVKEIDRNMDLDSLRDTKRPECMPRELHDEIIDITLSAISRLERQGYSLR